MFGSKGKGERAIESLVGGKMRIEGDISFEGGLRIDGNVHGSVRAMEGKSSMLVVSELASVKGAVQAAHVIVNGTIEGPVTATELLELQPKARVKGDVTYKALEMHNGAVVDGNLRHLGAAVEGRPELKVLTHGTKSAETA